MEMSFQYWLAGALQGISGFVSDKFDTLVALLVLYLGYKLLRQGLDKMPPDHAGINVYARYLAPGALMALFALTFVMGKGPVSLLIYLLVITIVAGLVFAYLGYRLFLKGVFGSTDLEAQWQERSIVLKRAAPGTLFALFGLVMISLALLGGPRILKEHAEIQVNAQQQLSETITKLGTEGLQLWREYLDNKQEGETEDRDE